MENLIKKSAKNWLKKVQKSTGIISRMLGWNAKNTESREISGAEIRDMAYLSQSYPRIVIRSRFFV